MKKSNDNIKKRAALVQYIINDTDNAAKYFELLAESLRQCKYTSEKIEVIAQCLFLSNRTIIYDTKRDIEKQYNYLINDLIR